MNTLNSRKKLTITIDPNILRKAKEAAKKRKIPLSRAIEGFLQFFSDPYVYCFSCGKKFSSRETEVCSKCGWLICPHCNACRCSLDEKSASVAFYMRKVYEDLLSGRLK